MYIQCICIYYYILSTIYYVFYIYVCDIIVGSQKCWKVVTATFFQLSQNVCFSIYDAFNAVSLCKPVCILHQISNLRTLNLPKICPVYPGSSTVIKT